MIIDRGKISSGQVYLSVLESKLQYDEDCTSDYVAVYDGKWAGLFQHGDLRTNRLKCRDLWILILEIGMTPEPIVDWLTLRPNF